MNRRHWSHESGQSWRKWGEPLYPELPPHVFIGSGAYCQSCMKDFYHRSHIQPALPRRRILKFLHTFFVLVSCIALGICIALGLVALGVNWPY